MRKPLKKFTDFTNTLLPNETTYLLSIQKFNDKDRLEILKRVDYNARHIDQFSPYDISIDKRKYNHLQNWISVRLKAIDVDEQFNKLLDWEQKINTDSIQAEDEKELLKTVKKYKLPTYFFSKFYELVEKYRHFLLIRLRYSDHQSVDDYLKNFSSDYINSKEIKEKLHEATLTIVGQYSGHGGESNQWEKWLSKVFFDEKLEGQIRYLALIRLVFICHNYRNYGLLLGKLDYLDKNLSNGFYYSKRLLVNYYNTRLMLHSHFKEYDQAVYFGYLSVRSKTHDYLLYVNNLCAVLLRLDRHQEALQLMKRASEEAKTTKNMHSRIGFVAFYMEALNKNKLCKNAEQYGDSFLKGYAKEIIQYRWHLFFSVYFEAMFKQGNFEKIVKVAHKYHLNELDKSYSQNANYLPLIPLYIEASHFIEGSSTQTDFYEILDSFNLKHDLQSNHILKTTLLGMKQWIPSISKYLSKK